LATSFLTATNRIYRVTSLNDVAGTITPDCTTTDLVLTTLDTASTMAAPTTGGGFPQDGQRLSFRITQDGTGNRTLAWNSIYTFRGLATPYLALQANSVTTFEFMYSTALTKWIHIPDAGWGTGRGACAYNQRTTNRTGIQSGGTPASIIDTSASVFANRCYALTAHGEVHTQAGFGASRIDISLRHTTDGSAPDGTDTTLTRSLVELPAENVDYTFHLEALYRPTTDHTLRLVLCGVGVFLAGHFYDTHATADLPTYLLVEDVGPRIEENGTDF
jgi:acyl-coenzyme A thioesterase PaaI-like protein